MRSRLYDTDYSEIIFDYEDTSSPIKEHQTLRVTSEGTYIIHTYTGSLPMCYIKHDSIKIVSLEEAKDWGISRMSKEEYGEAFLPRDSDPYDEYGLDHISLSPDAFRLLNIQREKTGFSASEILSKSVVLAYGSILKSH